MAIVTDEAAALARSEEAIPPLEQGDRLTRVEFERRYEAMRGLKKAELIEGRVYMPSPVKPVRTCAGGAMIGRQRRLGPTPSHFLRANPPSFIRLPPHNLKPPHVDGCPHRAAVDCGHVQPARQTFVRRSALEAYVTADTVNAATARQRGKAGYPSNQLAEHLSVIARLIEAGLPARVYYAIERGYDTHAAQLPTHARLLGELSGALAAFLDDLMQAGWPSGCW